MNNRSDALIPWRDRAFVSVAEAASILGRSPTWVYDRVTSRGLEAFQRSPGSRMVISVPSVLALIGRMRPVEEVGVPPLPKSRQHLSLVVNNDRGVR